MARSLHLATSRDVLTILIAHRLSTVMHADRIYVLERGRIVEEGRHSDLLELKGPMRQSSLPPAKNESGGPLH